MAPNHNSHHMSEILEVTFVPDTGCIDVGLQTDMPDTVMTKFRRHEGGSDPALRTYTDEMRQSELEIAIKIGSRLTRS